MKYYTDSLTQSQLDVLIRMGPLMNKWGFYLVGGTALTIYFRHRRSVDLDWFTQEQLADTLALAYAINDAGYSPNGTGCFTWGCSGCVC